MNSKQNHEPGYMVGNLLHFLSFRTSAKRFALATGLVVFSFFVALIWSDAGDRSVWILFFPSVLLAALYGGFCPGIFASFLSVICAVGVFFLRGHLDAFIEPGQRYDMGLFIVVSILTSLAAETMFWIRNQVHLLQTLKTYKAALSRIPGAVILFDDKGRYLDCNQQALTLAAKSKEEMEGKTLSDFLSPFAAKTLLEKNDPPPAKHLTLHNSSSPSAVQLHPCPLEEGGLGYCVFLSEIPSGDPRELPTPPRNISALS